MKCVLGFIVAVLAVSVNGETCPGGQASECDASHAHMSCTGTGYVPSCVDNVCTCSPSGGATSQPGGQPCHDSDDCNHLHGGCPGHLRWRCFHFDHTCHCTRH